MRGFQEAYERLVTAQQNRPTEEQLAELEAERREEQYRLKISRLRKSVA